MSTEGLFAQAYRDSHGEYRWRLKHTNGNVLSDSGEGYKNKAEMLNMLAKLHEGVPVEWLGDEG